MVNDISSLSKSKLFDNNNQNHMNNISCKSQKLILSVYKVSIKVEVLHCLCVNYRQLCFNSITSNIFEISKL